MTKADQVATMMKDMGYSKDEIRTISGSSVSRVERIARRQRIPINRGLVTNMLLDAYETAESANEMVNAARELGKLHGLYSPETTITMTAKGGELVKQIAAMPTEDLLRLMADDDPDTMIVEGEIVD